MENPILRNLVILLAILILSAILLGIATWRITRAEKKAALNERQRRKYGQELLH